MPILTGSFFASLSFDSTNQDQLSPKALFIPSPCDVNSLYCVKTYWYGYI
jgi:hypothetical protein